MLRFLFIASIAAAYSRLGAKYSRPAWLYSLVGGGAAFVFTLLSGVLVVLIVPETLSSKSDTKSIYKLLFLSMGFAALLCWLLYSLLEFILKREHKKNRLLDALDEDLE